MWEPGLCKWRPEMLYGRKQNTAQHDFLALKTTQKQKDKCNIPGGYLGPGEILGIESCHSVFLRVQTRLGLDTGHREVLHGMKRNRDLLGLGLGVGALLPDLQVPAVT
jgi:hypothetical protein